MMACCQHALVLPLLSGALTTLRTDGKEQLSPPPVTSSAMLDGRLKTDSIGCTSNTRHRYQETPTPPLFGGSHSTRINGLIGRTKKVYPWAQLKKPMRPCTNDEHAMHAEHNMTFCYTCGKRLRSLRPSDEKAGSAVVESFRYALKKGKLQQRIHEEWVDVDPENIPVGYLARAHHWRIIPQNVHAQPPATGASVDTHTNHTNT